MDENPVVEPVNPVTSEPVQNKRSFWQVISSSRSRTFGIIAIAIIIVAIPLTVIISQQQQQTKQEASTACGDYKSSEVQTIEAACRLSGGTPTTTTTGNTTYPYHVCCTTSPPTSGEGGSGGSTHDQCAPLSSKALAEKAASLCTGGYIKEVNGVWNACCVSSCFKDNWLCSSPTQCCSGQCGKNIAIDKQNTICYSGTLTKVDGACGSTNNTCISGALVDMPDSNAEYVWTCMGSGGGIDASCKISKTSGYSCNRCSNIFKYYYAKWNTDQGTACEENTWNQSKVYTVDCTCLGGSTNYSQNGYTLSNPSTQCAVKPDCDKTPVCTGACTAKSTNSCGSAGGTKTNCNFTETSTDTRNPTNCTVKATSNQDCTITCTSGTCSSPTNGTCQTTACTGNTSKNPYQCSGGTCQRVTTSSCQADTCNPSDPNSCGTSCTSPKSNPHFECQSNKCTSVATCAENSGGCTSAGGSCGTTPTSTPTPTPQSGSMTLAFNIGLDGIGAAGDHPLPCTSLSSCTSNKTPGRTSRDLNISVLDQSGADKTPNSKISVTYNQSTGFFGGNLGVNLTPGSYTVKVKSPGFLKKTLVSIQNLVSGNNQIPLGNLTNGDIDGDNQLTVLDYNILISCSIYGNAALCNNNAEYKTLSDLNDNGVVDEIDYNLFLREYSVQNGD